MPPEVRPFVPERDAEEVAALVGACFAEWSGPRHLWYLRNLDKKDWKYHRCLVDDGRMVAYLAIRPREMYVGKALLKMAGVAIVCTHPDARSKGYGRMLMDDTLGFMPGDGFDVSVLYGIPNYYHKFGYEVVMSRHSFSVSQPELPADELRYGESGLSQADMAGVLALYSAQTRYRDGNCRRKEMAPSEGAFKLTDVRGRLAAYAYTYPAEGSLAVSEAIAVDNEAARQLLTALRLAAGRQGLTEINIAMPSGYPVTDVLRSSNCVHRRDNTCGHGCMGRVVSLARLVAKMQAEWTALIGRSELAGRTGSLALGVGDEAVRISYSRGMVKAAVVDGRAASRVTRERFVQMVHGYRSVRDLASDRDVTFRRADVRALEVLFPERNAFLFGADQF
jgi:predicted acetyltransferase